MGSANARATHITFLVLWSSYFQKATHSPLASHSWITCLPLKARRVPYVQFSHGLDLGNMGAELLCGSNYMVIPKLLILEHDDLYK